MFTLVGKKNSKTTSGAGLMVTALLMNEVPWAEFLFIGPTQEIADLAFQQAAGMVEADPDGYLAKRFHVVDHKKTISDRRTKAFVKVKTFDVKRHHRPETDRRPDRRAARDRHDRTTRTRSSGKSAAALYRSLKSS